MISLYSCFFVTFGSLAICFYLQEEEEEDDSHKIFSKESATVSLEQSGTEEISSKIEAAGAPTVFSDNTSSVHLKGATSETCEVDLERDSSETSNEDSDVEDVAMAPSFEEAGSFRNNKISSTSEPEFAMLDPFLSGQPLGSDDSTRNVNSLGNEDPLENVDPLTYDSTGEHVNENVNLSHTSTSSSQAVDGIEEEELLPQCGNGDGDTQQPSHISLSEDTVEGVEPPAVSHTQQCATNSGGVGGGVGGERSSPLESVLYSD